MAVGGGRVANVRPGDLENAFHIPTQLLFARPSPTGTGERALNATFYKAFCVYGPV